MDPSHAPSMNAPLGSSSYPPPYRASGNADWGRRRRGPPTWVIVALVAVVAVAVLGTVSWWYFAASRGVGPAGPYAFWPFFPFGIFFVLFVVFFLVRIAFWSSYGGRGPRGWGYGYRQRAQDILAERYARGEITREQYQQMLRDLESP